jgi:hypothetical protein
MKSGADRGICFRSLTEALDTSPLVLGIGEIVGGWGRIAPDLCHRWDSSSKIRFAILYGCDVLLLALRLLAGEPLPPRNLTQYPTYLRHRRQTRLHAGGNGIRTIGPR